MTRTKVGKEDAQAFVESLKNFNDILPLEQQTMLGTILAAAQQDETAGYGRRFPRNESGQSAEGETAGYKVRFPRSETEQTAGEDETAGYAIKRPRSESDPVEQQDETAGYGLKRPRSETPVQDDEERWERLAAWLGREDETSGYQAKYKF